MMKILLSSVLLTTFLFTGCSKLQTDTSNKQTESIPVLNESKEVQQAKLQESLHKWEQLKEQRGANYQYTNAMINWGGSKSETTIIVKDDFVLNRYYYLLNTDNVITTNWREVGFDALNSHTQGAPTHRMEALYDSCKNIIAKEDNVILSFDYNGILQKCTYGKKGISLQNLVFVTH